MAGQCVGCLHTTPVASLDLELERVFLALIKSAADLGIPVYDNPCVKQEDGSTAMCTECTTDLQIVARFLERVRTARFPQHLSLEIEFKQDDMDYEPGDANDFEQKPVEMPGVVIDDRHRSNQLAKSESNNKGKKKREKSKTDNDSDHEWAPDNDYKDESESDSEYEGKQEKFKFDIKNESTSAKVKAIKRDLSTMCEMIKITHSELEKIREEMRRSAYYLRPQYRCETCVLGIPYKTAYLKHMAHHKAVSMTLCA